MNNKRFELGKTVMTRGIATRCEEDSEFYNFVQKCVGRHASCDWGDAPEDDKATNNEGVDNEGMLMSVYHYGDNANDRIWVITEWDRSVTTVLLPEEY